MLVPVRGLGRIDGHAAHGIGGAARRRAWRRPVAM
jgi:hypothetical protein